MFKFPGKILIKYFIRICTEIVVVHAYLFRYLSLHIHISTVSILNYRKLCLTEFILDLKKGRALKAKRNTTFKKKGGPPPPLP